RFSVPAGRSPAGGGRGGRDEAGRRRGTAGQRGKPAGPPSESGRKRRNPPPAAPSGDRGRRVAASPYRGRLRGGARLVVQHTVDQAGLRGEDDGLLQGVRIAVGAAVAEATALRALV